MEDGSPQITPVWIDVDDKQNIIIINTAKGRLKQRNITRDPRVAISIVNRNNDYQMLSVRGKVIEQATSGADEHTDKLAKKYLDVEQYPFRNPQEQRVLLKIKPIRIMEMRPQ